jgi:ubiquinone/menaquinone biosynthesis C-methylase UbiE
MEAMMHVGETGQVTHDAAEVYDELFVPALFGPWASRVADAAYLRSGERVLDVACGTGILAEAVADRVGPGGTVVGLDINDGMLAVARRRAPAIEWRHAPAEALPFDGRTFDAVVSQFGLMDFEARRRALEEMTRVLRPGGSLAVAVWASLDQQPGYAALVDLLDRLFGYQVGSAKRAPFVLGDRSLLGALFAEAGISNAQITTGSCRARFPSIESWIHTEIRGWTLADALDDAQVDLLVREAQVACRP